MRKLIRVIGVATCVLLLTGCTQVTNLTNEQNDIVAEYAAGIMLNHSFFNEGKYIEETETETETETPVINPSEEETTTLVGETTGPEETTASNVFDCAKDIGIEPLTVTYSTYEVTDEYPNNSDALFTFSADNGYKLLIVKFTLSNPTNGAVTANTSASHPVFKVNINSKNKYNNYGNLLLNDISNLNNVTLEAGKSEEVVLVFMVEQDIADAITSMTLTPVDGKSEIKLK